MAALRCALILAVLAAAPAVADGVARIVVQHSPLAGLRHYEGRTLWDAMQVGDRLVLVREPANPHDPNAVAIEWNGRRIGYVPRRENVDLARQIDYGAAAEARITALDRSRNGRNRVSYEISVPLK